MTEASLSDQVLKVLRTGTLEDFVTLRAEERLALCHRVANLWHPKRDSDARAARARTFFDMLQMFYYYGDHKSSVADCLILIETKNEAAKKAQEKLLP